MLLEIDLFQKKKVKKQEEEEKKIKSKLHEIWAIPMSISTTKDVTCCSKWLYLYLSFFYYIKLLLFVNANVIHHV